MQNIPIEWSQPSDIYKDFRVLPYDPSSPTDGRIRSASLLFASFAAFGVLERGLQIVELMRRQFGLFATGWGCKLRAEGPTWELYWYNEQFEPRTKSVAHLATALEPLGGLRVAVDPAIPYASFSLDLDELLESSDGVTRLNLYFGKGVDERCPGYSYLATEDSLTLQNAYYVAEVGNEEQMRELRYRMVYSARNGATEAVDSVLDRIPDPCKYVYFVHKPTCDSFYYSQTDLSFFRQFVTWANFPPLISEFLDEHAQRLDHLRWDMGLNYLVTDGELEVTKVGFYGYF